MTCDSLCNCCVKGMCYSFTYSCESLTIKCNPSNCLFNKCRDEFQCLDGYEYHSFVIDKFKYLMLVILTLLVIYFMLTNSGIKWCLEKKNKVRSIKSISVIKRPKITYDHEKVLISHISDLNSN